MRNRTKQHKHIQPRPSIRLMAWLGHAYVKLTVLGVLTCLIVTALQITVFSRMPLFYLSPGAPSLTILLALGTGFLLGEREGAVIGLMAGTFADVANGEMYVILPLLYTLCGYLVGVLSKDRLGHNLPSFLVWTLVGSVWEQVCRYGRAAVTAHGLPPAEILKHDLLPSLIWTLLFAPLMYLAVRGIIKIFVRK